MNRQLCVRGQLRRGDFTLDINLDLSLEHATGVQGVTGAGKTTLLRVIAGVEPAFHGNVHFGNECWSDSEKGIYVPTHQRGLGVVTQQCQLLPGMSVQANLDYAMRRAAAVEPCLSFREVVVGLHIEALLTKGEETLSGGERQRVALAQALLSKPRLILLDEPLSANDETQRQQISERLSIWIAALDLPMIYVSHAPEELERLTRYLVVMQAGVIAAQGDTRAMVVADRAAMQTMLDDAIRMVSARVLRVDLAEKTLMLAWDDANNLSGALVPNSHVLVRIPRDNPSASLQVPLQCETPQNQSESAKRVQTQGFAGNEPDEKQ